jgi:NhaP-type Na+/H+ and K+/H+ antiporters with a unique C-terminal domain
MFVMLGLLVWPQRLLESIWPALAVAATLMFIARPVAVFLCLAPFRFQWREKAFISWVGLRGAVGIFLASIPLLVHLPYAYLYFDIAFVVVLTSLLVQGWTIPARRGGCTSRCRATIPCRDASSSTCRGSSSRKSWAIRCPSTAPI